MMKADPWKNLLWSTLLALTLVLSGTQALAVASGSSPPAVPWTQLPYYLENRGITLDQELPLCDCPRGLDEEKPTHHILQVIANTLYEWREYRFMGVGQQPRMALIMIRPQARRLSAEEARILLTASATWHRPVPAGGRQVASPTGSGTLTRIPVVNNESRTPSRAGPDQPKVINPVQLEQFPCNTVACLDISDLGKTYRGTGFLVSPYCLLTAGHNVYWKDHWVDSIRVIPAQYTDNNSYNTIMPYGERLCPTRDLRSNRAFIEESRIIEISEFDYGAILTSRPFPEIKTFMPLEFHHPDQELPPLTEISGYPLYPDNTLLASNNPWLASGMTYDSPDGAYQQFIRVTTPVFGGNSGSPICYHNLLGQVRAIGITTWRNLSLPGGGGILLTSLNEKLIRSWLAYTPASEFTRISYAPYFSNRPGTWTGLALANPNPETCWIKVEYFATDGRPVGNQFLEIRANGQAAFACSPNQDPYCASGWLKISSTRPVSGLALVGSNNPSNMFDMDLKSSLHKQLLFPHLAATREWHSTVMLCNPDRENAASLNFTWLQPDGTPVTKQSSVVADGSLALDLEKLFQQPLNGGQLILTSSRPLAAFLLYSNTRNETDNRQNLWQAGLSAIPLDPTN